MVIRLRPCMIMSTPPQRVSFIKGVMEFLLDHGVAGRYPLPQPVVIQIIVLRLDSLANTFYCTLLAMFRLLLLPVFPDVSWASNAAHGVSGHACRTQ